MTVTIDDVLLRACADRILAGTPPQHLTPLLPRPTLVRLTSLLTGHWRFAIGMATANTLITQLALGSGIEPAATLAGTGLDTARRMAHLLGVYADPLIPRLHRLGYTLSTEMHLDPRYLHDLVDAGRAVIAARAH